MLSSTHYVVTCLAHANGPALDKARALEACIRSAYAASFGPRARVSCVWVEIPAGTAFVAGQPSSLSSVMAPVPDDVAQPDREAFMHAICHGWMTETGCNQSEVMVVALGATRHGAHTRVSRERLGGTAAFTSTARVAMQMAKHRLVDGFLKTSTRLP